MHDKHRQAINYIYDNGRDDLLEPARGLHGAPAAGHGLEPGHTGVEAVGLGGAKAGGTDGGAAAQEGRPLAAGAAAAVAAAPRRPRLVEQLVGGGGGGGMVGGGMVQLLLEPGGFQSSSVSPGAQL